MSTSTDLPDRPAFQSWEPESQLDRPPVSRLAIAAFLAGLLSLLAAFSTILLPLSMLAVAVGIAAVWKLSRSTHLSGLWLAQIGLAMAAASVVWSISATSGRQQYFYQSAAQHAQVLLELLGQGRTYEALELRMPENGRQLTGTDLKKYYAQLKDEAADDVRSFLENPVTKEVIEAGPEADWQYVRGVSVVDMGNVSDVTVEMVNRASPDNQRVHVKMRRNLGLVADPERQATTAMWNFEELLRP